MAIGIRSSMVVAALALGGFATVGVAGGEEIGVPARGGHPEYLFLESVPKEQAPATAALIAKSVFTGRTVIFAQMDRLTNPELGDKGFTGDAFEQQWREALKADLMDVTPEQKRIMEKVFWAGKLAIDVNQDRLNVKGVKWKHFLPAKWEREMSQPLNARTGIIVKQPARNYRNPVNRPDALEKEVLSGYVQGRYGDKLSYAVTTTMGKQPVYRYLEPIRLIPPCMGCHGKPKGQPDMLGFEKDGFEVGDVIGLMSVTLAVK
jgi:general secretion pathway protein A